MKNPLSEKELKLMDSYWRAANYLSVGQIYLYDNPLLKTPLRKEHVKPRLLGHWGTTPGLNFIYVHLNRVIKKRDLSMIYITGPGHGGPGLVANAYLEGTYSEVYPNISQDEEGMKRLFAQFSFPGGIPSHVAPETPGSIHEGGELGYAISHAYGAAFDNQNLIVACVVGDGEAETGPLATSWHSNKFLNPASDGAVLPILHLNGYKIANPTVLARISKQELEQLFRGYGYVPFFVEGEDPPKMHQQMASILDVCIDEIQRIQSTARKHGFKQRPIWPMIILRSPKGWTCPKEIDGKRTEDYWRSHQVPMGEMHQKPSHIKLLDKWPLQVLVSISALANDGKLMKPTIIHDVLDNESNIIQPFKPKMLWDITKDPKITIFEDNIPTEQKKVVQPWVVQKAKEGMRMVVTEGTMAKEFATWTEIPSAGKTGTAEYCDNVAQANNLCVPGSWPAHAWYVGYAPYDNPEIAVVAFVYNGGEGSSVAGPIVREVISAYFDLKAMNNPQPNQP